MNEAQSLHGDQFILPGAEADLYGVLQGFLPGSVRVAVLPYIAVVMEMRIMQMLAQLAVGEGRCLFTEIHAGLIQCHRIKGSQHADVRQDRGVVLAVAVTVRGNVRD